MEQEIEFGSDCGILTHAFTVENKIKNQLGKIHGESDPITTYVSLMLLCRTFLLSSCTRHESLEQDDTET